MIEGLNFGEWGLQEELSHWGHVLAGTVRPGLSALAGPCKLYSLQAPPPWRQGLRECLLNWTQLALAMPQSLPNCKPGNAPPTLFKVSCLWHCNVVQSWHPHHDVHACQRFLPCQSHTCPSSWCPLPVALSSVSRLLFFVHLQDVK